MNTYYVPGSVLSARDTVVRKTGKVPPTPGLYSSRGRPTVNEIKACYIKDECYEE